jgi:hypothetical protein
MNTKSSPRTGRRLFIINNQPGTGTRLLPWLIDIAKSLRSSSASSTTTGATVCPAADAKPVAARTNAASARAIGSPITAAITRTERPLAFPLKTSDFAISAMVQPMAAAASVADRELSSNSLTG